jgi:hypothetical protein
MTSTFLVLLQRLHRSLTICLYIMYKRGTFAKKEEKKIKTNTILLFWFLFDFRMYSMTHCILTLISVIYFVDVCKREILYIKMSYDVKLGARVAQWVRSLDLTTHTSLSPIRRGFAPGFVDYKKGCTRLAAASDKVYQLLAHGRWFSPGTPASSTTKTGRHDIAAILLKVALRHQQSKSNQSIKLVFKLSHSQLWPWSYNSWCTIYRWNQWL